MEDKLVNYKIFGVHISSNCKVNRNLLHDNHSKAVYLVALAHADKARSTSTRMGVFIALSPSSYGSLQMYTMLYTTHISSIGQLITLLTSRKHKPSLIVGY